MPDPFTGFPAETFAFLKALREENTRDFFEAHKQDYTDHILTPSLDFIESLAPRIADLGYTATPKLNGSFRRLNRDVRFSKDKTPYSPRIHLIFWTGDHPLRSPAVHMALHADSVGFGAGEWGWPPARLAAFRERLNDDAALRALQTALSTAETIGATIGQPALKRMPKGWDADHPAEDLLRHKSLVVRTRDPLPLPETLHSAEFIGTAVEIIRSLAPVNNWLNSELS